MQWRILSFQQENRSTALASMSKRRRLDGSDVTREEFMQNPDLSSREKRALTRGWSKRERKLREDFEKRGSYLSTRIYDLTIDIHNNEQHILRLDTALRRRDLTSLFAPSSTPSVEVAPKAKSNAAADGAACNPKVKTKEGYDRKAKGKKQYLWERGWWKGGMSAAAGVADEKNIDMILQALPDFKTERTALQHVVESRGHILLLSPKCHPEAAGVGIEYSWGFSKQKFSTQTLKHLCVQQST